MTFNEQVERAKNAAIDSLDRLHENSNISVGRVENMIEAFADALKEPEPVKEMSDLSRCPECGGPADQGHDRCRPPTAYLCSKCDSPEKEPESVDDDKEPKGFVSTKPSSGKMEPLVRHPDGRTWIKITEGPTRGIKRCVDEDRLCPDEAHLTPAEAWRVGALVRWTFGNYMVQGEIRTRLSDRNLRGGRDTEIMGHALGWYDSEDLTLVEPAPEMADE